MMSRWRFSTNGLRVYGDGSGKGRSSRAGEEANSWLEKLAPQGPETRLGDALKKPLEQLSGSPLAGILLFSDGGTNSGIDPLAIAEMAAKRQVPIYTVGVGSTSRRRNLRVQEIGAPSRVYPGDKTTVTALIHAEGFAHRTVNVELLVREAHPKGKGADRVGQQSLSIDQESQVVPLQFEIEPAEIGRLVLELKIVAPADDQYAADNRREVEIEVVEAQTRVLLIASGATREISFFTEPTPS